MTITFHLGRRQLATLDTAYAPGTGSFLRLGGVLYQVAGIHYTYTGTDDNPLVDVALAETDYIIEGHSIVRERDALRAAAVELLRLKDIKDAQGATEEYERDKPGAWEALRAATYPDGQATEEGTRARPEGEG